MTPAIHTQCQRVAVEVHSAPVLLPGARAFAQPQAPVERRGIRLLRLVWLVLVALSLSLRPDVSRAEDSLNVRRLGQLRRWNGANAMDVQGGFAYVVDHGGLTILDVRIPAFPVVVASTAVTYFADDIAVSGNRAYIPYHDEPDFGGLQVMDVSDPANPIEITCFDIQVGFVSVEIVGNFAYVGDYYGYLRILDISNPTLPVQVGAYSYDTTSFIPSAVEVVGNRAFVADWSGGLRILDVSNLTNPTEIGSCSAPAVVRDVAASGNYAYLASSGGLRVIDISNPNAPVEVGFCPTSGSAGRVAVSGNYAYVADPDGGLRIVDVSNPNAPVEVSNQDSAGVEAVTIRGDTAYVVNRYWGLRIVDISNPAAPALLGNYGSFLYAARVAVRGNYAYVLDPWANGLRIVDISNPSLPVPLGPFTVVPYRISDLVISGNYAYLAAVGLQILDITIPTNPVETGRSAPFVAYGVIVQGNYAFVATRDSGLLVFDVSNPSAPAEVGAWSTSYSLTGVDADNGYAYLTAGYDGLRIINVTDPSAPVEVGAFVTPRYARGVAVSGGHAYVATADSGVRIIHVANPMAPTEVGSYSTRWAMDVKIRGNYAYIADELAGLRILDISTPTSPVETGYYDGPGTAYGVAVRDGLAYVASWCYLVIYDCHAALQTSFDQPGASPREFALYPCYPNPFNQSTTIHFSLPQSEHVTLTIYDVTGREVETLVSQALGAGEHRVAFDGSGLASGVYFINLAAMGEHRTEKVVLLK